MVKALCLGYQFETKPAVGNRLGSNPSSARFFFIFAFKLLFQACIFIFQLFYEFTELLADSFRTCALRLRLCNRLMTLANENTHIPVLFQKEKGVSAVANLVATTQQMPSINASDAGKAPSVSVPRMDETGYLQCTRSRSVGGKARRACAKKLVGHGMHFERLIAWMHDLVFNYTCEKLTKRKKHHQVSESVTLP